MDSSRIDAAARARLRACALVAATLRRLALQDQAASVAIAAHTANRALEAAGRTLGRRERLKAIAERSQALATSLGISTAALRAAAAVDLLTDPDRLSALIGELDRELDELARLQEQLEQEEQLELRERQEQRLARERTKSQAHELQEQRQALHRYLAMRAASVLLGALLESARGKRVPLHQVVAGEALSVLAGL
jgi:hypothetical protein